MELTGLGAAPGIAVGPVWRHREVGAGIPLPDVRAAADRASTELHELAERVRRLGRNEDAAIFDAQALMAVDPMLLDEAEQRAAALPTRDPDALAAAVETVSRAVAEMLANLPDELLAARATDVRDVGSRIARIVAGRALVLPDRPSIAIADDLPPSVTAEIPDGLLLGIALERGSAVSHAAILARGLGIPAVVAVHGLLEATDVAEAERADDVPEARPSITAAVDGATGRVILDPDETQRAELADTARRRDQAAGAARALRGEPGATADGHRIPLIANIGRPEDAARAIESGAEGVGLFRTEFCFVGRSDPPSEQEQVDAYRRVLDAFGDRPVVFRLADIGGDKPIPYLHLAAESNPFLGVRGLRLAYDDPTLYVTQLRALWRAGAGAPSVPHVMAPMVGTDADVDLLRELVERARSELDDAGLPRAERLVVGIMVEVPSAALLADDLGRRVDFFSVGSNDLTQYLLAMDRTHPRLAPIADALHPAVLRAIRATIDGAHRSGVPVAVCGELAGDPLGAMVLAGLGIDELSMDAGSLDAVRFALRAQPLEALRALAAAALQARGAEEVRELARGRLVQPGD